MSNLSPESVREAVRDNYGAVARGEVSGCCAPSCCAPGAVLPTGGSEALGYSAAELNSLPEGVDLGLGCGNPLAIARLQPGETVLDLGSGPGLDCLLAAQRVGPEGRVIGVDMTADMVKKARANAVSAGVENVSFRLGEIEHLPVSDGSVDAILSNCVVNLSPDKAAVYADAFRVLKPGGRLAIRDVVLTAPVPDELAQSVAALVGCAAGAAQASEVVEILKGAGFTDIRVDVDEKSRTMIDEWLPDMGAGDVAASAEIRARKPEAV
jgi:arsenite methyltransferase